MLRKTVLVMAVALMVLAIPAARATTITLSDSDLAALSFGTAIYEVRVNPAGHLVPGQTTFTAPVAGAGPEFLTAAGTTVVLSGYSIPFGSTLDSATLDVAAIIDTTVPLGYIMSGSGGTVGTWRPTFTSTSSELILTVSSGATSVVVNAASVSGLDLIADGFSSHLLAGDAINITWNQTISIAASSASYGSTGDWSDAIRYFALSQTNSTTVTGTLEIDYTPGPSSVPEPASYFLMGAGLLMLARFRR